ncbi:MAG: type II CRISPR RNA-guided endonuclease Cas9 [Planctomycetes bacterium]|nr:type II CRISPR RNA-guided endonuclease Cas9 [Planctomycetota bacterium]
MENFTLGLDIGTNSVGWAIVECDDNKKPTRLIDLNARIFQEMVEGPEYKRVPKNKNRREKRGARRLTSRYKERRTKLVKLLIENGMLPKSMENMEDWKKTFNSIGEPFSLRAKGLDEPLTPHQFGRVLMHLLRRRGYRSNRGAKYIDLMKHPEVVKLSKPELEDDDTSDDEDKKKVDERKKVLMGISQLQKEMEKCQTLGEFIYKTCRNQNHEPRRITQLEFNDITLYANRKMYEDEFNALWDKQKNYLPLTDVLKVQIHEAILFQRPLQIQKNLVGKCSFEQSRKRAAKALLEAQEFRMLQELNDLNVTLPNDTPNSLTQEQRNKLVEELNNPEKLNDKGLLTWSEVKNLLGLGKKVKFNLQETAKNGLSGNKTNLALSKAIPEHWSKFSPQDKHALIEDLLTIQDKKALFERLINQHNRKGNRWTFSSEEAYTLATLELEKGYVKHCLKVINKLLPDMRKGMNYHDACQKTGYLRKDQIPIIQTPELPSPPYVANPIVQKALYETRRVVNTILKVYGRPNSIRIELAREMKASKKHREKIQKEQTKNKERNEEAKNEILKYQNSVSGEDIGKDIIKYKLWKEQDEQCAYSGKHIHPPTLFSESGEVEVDHIFPLSRSHDNSYLNKVLCLKSENDEKDNRTPFEAWGGTEKYQNILRRFEKLKIDQRKLKKIRETNFNADDFVAAQLNDARYISVTAKNYLEQLGIPVQVTTGRATAEIRRLLGLNNILPKRHQLAAESNENDVEGDNEEVKKSSTAKKRDDHRHHAIDALITALTDKPLFDELTKRYRHKEKTGKWPDEKLEKFWGWDNLREAVKETLIKSVVSHTVNRKIWSALHKEMPFGKRTYYLEGIPHQYYVKRIPVKEALKYTENNPSKKTWIVDQVVRNVLTEWKASNNPADVGKNPPKMPNKKYPEPCAHALNALNPIKSVRVAKTFSPSSIRCIGKEETQFFELGSNHHVVIFRNKETGERDGWVVSMLEAASRVRKPPIIRTQYPEFDPNDWEFEMFLCANDMVEWDIEDPKWQEKQKEEHQSLGLPVYRVQKISQGKSGITITFRHHSVTATEDKDNWGVLRASPSTIRCKKIIMDALGKYTIEK